MSYNLKIIDIIKENYNVKTFRLEKKFNFKPGEHCFVIYEGAKRPFTISSSYKSNFIDLTIKKSGYVTTNLFKLNKGDFIEIEGPIKSKLSLNFNSKKEYVFIAGGSGITPFSSILLSYPHLKNNIKVFFSNSTKKDIFFKDRLSEFDVDFIVTKRDGRIDKEFLIKNIENLENKMFVLCGPKVMEKSIRNDLNELDVIDSKIVSFY